MSNDRDELAEVLRRHRYKREEAVCSCSDLVQVGLRCDSETHEQHAAGIILTAGYRKVFDGDCGLSNVKDPSDREAAEAWMRFSNIVLGNGHDGIAAMKQMLTEFGYRKVEATK